MSRRVPPTTRPAPTETSPLPIETQSTIRLVEAPEAELAKVNIQRHAFHGDWNYTIHPTATVIPS